MEKISLDFRKYSAVRKVIQSDLSDIDSSNQKEVQNREAVECEFEIIGKYLEVFPGKERIEWWAAEIETKLREMTQYQKLSGPENAPAMTDYLVKIENLLQESHACDEAIKTLIFKWEMEKNTLEKKERVLEETIKDQKELIFSKEKRVCSLNFITNAEEEMAKHLIKMAEFHYAERELKSHLEQFIKSIPISRYELKELVGILYSHWNYICRREDRKPNSDNIEGPDGSKEIFPHYGGTEDTFKSALLVLERVHQLAIDLSVDRNMQNLKQQMEELDSKIKYQYKHKDDFYFTSGVITSGIINRKLERNRYSHRKC